MCLKKLIENSIEQVNITTEIDEDRFIINLHLYNKQSSPWYYSLIFRVMNPQRPS